MGGSIGITPMIAVAHRLYETGADFELHYSGQTRETMGFLEDIASFPWANQAHLHISSEGSRAQMDGILKYVDGAHVYTCGAEPYMQAIMDAAVAAGFPEEYRNLEYFSVPEAPEYENHPFSIKLAKSGKTLDVPADKSAADVLTANGVTVDIKCSDGICGVCKCGFISGDVEHRDYVLPKAQSPKPKAQRETAIVTCQSMAAEPDGVIALNI